MDSCGQETTDTDDVPTHPAVLGVFRTDNILEEICSYLGFNDLKQFRLVSKDCNIEGRRALIKRDRHWLVVKSGNDDWQLGLDNLLTNLEQAASDGGENSHKKLLGWIFKRLELNYWEFSLGFLEQWGHYLRKIHLNAECFSIFHFINTLHRLLTVCCPNLDEIVMDAENRWLSSGFTNQSVEFPSPLLKLKCLRLKNLKVKFCTDEEREVVERFFTGLVTAAITSLETLEIGSNGGVEERMLESLALNVGVSNFQCLKEITLESSNHVANLSHTVQKCFSKLTKLILWKFLSAPIMDIRPESFSALKSLTIHDSSYLDITCQIIQHFLQHFPNLEVLIISSSDEWTDEWMIIVPYPILPLSGSLQSFTFETKDYDLLLLRQAVNMFPNLVTLNLLGFGRGSRLSPEPEYSFGELTDVISPLSRLQNLYVNHAFHTSPQLVDAIQLTSNLTALQTIVLSQAAHNEDYDGRDFNVSLYLTTSDPQFQYILDCDTVTRLKSVQLLRFRFGTTEEEVEEEAAAKGGHVSFGTICPCYFKPWICPTQNRLKTCHNPNNHR